MRYVDCGWRCQPRRAHGHFIKGALALPSQRLRPPQRVAVCFIIVARSQAGGYRLSRSRQPAQPDVCRIERDRAGIVGRLQLFLQLIK